MAVTNTDASSNLSIVPCPDINEALRFFRERLGFRLDAIAPADDPSVALVSSHGLALVLQSEAHDDADASLRMLTEGPHVPALAPSLVVTRNDDAAWKTGRAGMRYRDLIPDRQGGRFVASHIRIESGGPVPDDVHFHDVRFQTIYCVNGWVTVVYEDQGPPFTLRAGDCVLQPPKIRHRVLEASAGLEVVELACPARHPTCLDHELALPTNTVAGDRSFDGQRFVRHGAASATWSPSGVGGFECRDTGIHDATGGLADVRVMRRTRETIEREPRSHDLELSFGFVLAGGLTLRLGETSTERLEPGDAFVVPAGRPHAWAAATDDVELLAVSLPGR